MKKIPLISLIFFILWAFTKCESSPPPYYKKDATNEEYEAVLKTCEEAKDRGIDYELSLDSKNYHKAWAHGDYNKDECFKENGFIKDDGGIPNAEPIEQKVSSEVSAKNEEPTKATDSTINMSNLATKGYTSNGLTKADLAWHAVNTYGFLDCDEVISKGETMEGGYFLITCAKGMKLKVYLRSGKHPNITENQTEEYEIDKEPTPSVSMNDTDKNNAKKAIDKANRQINIVWNGSAKKFRKVLLPEQREWLEKRKSECDIKATTDEPIDSVLQDTIRFNCMTEMTVKRTEELETKVKTLEEQATLPQMPDELRQNYLCVAIDRASRWVYLEILPTNQPQIHTLLLTHWLPKLRLKLRKY